MWLESGELEVLEQQEQFLE
ncbi:hypothetical protein Tco_0351701, partial [Tanacetum coccineum]